MAPWDPPCPEQTDTTENITFSHSVTGRKNQWSVNDIFRRDLISRSSIVYSERQLRNWTLPKHFLNILVANVYLAQ